MHLSKRTQYGLRAAVRLANDFASGGLAQSRDIAAAERMPTKFLEQVLLVLRRAGLLESKVGSGGGYRLSRDPTQVTVAQVLEALELSEELDLPDPPTDGGRATQLVVARLTEARRKTLSGYTLQDLVDEARAAASASPVMYHI